MSVPCRHKKSMFFQYALEFISLLQDIQYLQQSICLLLWETHLKELFKGLFEWLNKAEEVPNDRLAKKYIGLGRNQLVSIIFCVYFSLVGF